MKQDVPHQTPESVVEQAALYALGMLNMHEARAFERSIGEGRADCAAELREFESVVAGIGLSACEQSPPTRIREKLLARIGQDFPAAKPAAKPKVPTKFLTLRADEGKWREIDHRAFIKKLFKDEVRGTMTSLIKLLPGGRLRGHRHHSVEECYIIDGDYHVNGEVLGPGDYHCALPGSVDEGLFSIGGAVFLLVAPLQYDPLK